MTRAGNSLSMKIQVKNIYLILQNKFQGLRIKASLNKKSKVVQKIYNKHTSLHEKEIL